LRTNELYFWKAIHLDLLGTLATEISIHSNHTPLRIDELNNFNEIENLRWNVWKY